MCDYCGCRELTPIGELSAEHEEITERAGALERRLAAGEDATAELVALQLALGPHLHKEERGLFAQLARHPEFAGYLERLGADHASARAVLLRVTRADRESAPALLAGLRELETHIESEELDFFPASRLILDDESWSEVAEAHLRANADHPHPATTG